MGFEFSSNSKVTMLNWDSWRRIFQLAFQHGWHPAGTFLSGDSIKDWGGSYFSNDFQYVLQKDAWNLAASLRVALYSFVTDGRSGRPSEVRRLSEDQKREIEWFWGGSVESLMVTVEIDAYDVKFIKDFVDFFERGTFMIT